MAYSELVKNFNHIREYMREFYIYGFKSRDEFNKKSGRAYDDERRRIESWLGDYMQFRQTPSGKNVFLSIDSRFTRHNPLYKAWKAKSFTDGEITLHFALFDILSSPEKSLTLGDITATVDEMLSGFEEPRDFDESTIRKRLKAYEQEGLILTEKKGRTIYYRRAESINLREKDYLDFFSEVAPCGVIGSFLLDKTEASGDCFAFKHHYIASAMDSEILHDLFVAMKEKRAVYINNHSTEHLIVPLRIFISVQNGRQYLVCYMPEKNRMRSYRTDNIQTVKLADEYPDFDKRREMLTCMQEHMWGVSMQSTTGQRLEHVEFTVTYKDHEKHIHHRLEREKRCGHVEKLDENRSRFSADVYDASELIPWSRTFICRITEIHFSNEVLEQQFKEDLASMYVLYGLGGGEER